MQGIVRVIGHWTAGTNKVTQLDIKHYHYSHDGKGVTHEGNHSLQDNHSTADGNYAAHTLHCNTGSAGVSACGMLGATEHPLDYGKQPVTKAGWDAMCETTATICENYGIKVTKRTVLTHAEVQETLGIKQRGKWDYTILPFAPEIIGAEACGNRFRNDVAWIMKKRRKGAPVNGKTTVVAAGGAGLIGVLYMIWDKIF